MGREIVPAELIVPAMPLLDGEWVARRLRGEGGGGRTAQMIDIRGIRTHTTCVDEAERLSRVVLRDLERAIRCGDRTYVAKALQDRPELILVRSIRSTLSRWISNGSLRPPRGRPRGSAAWCPPVVAGLVDHLVSTGGARNRENAFASLSVLGLSYDSAKRLYWQASREQRFRPLLLLDEELARPVEDRDRRWMASAQPLLPGRPVLRRCHDPAVGGTVNIEFTAAS